MPLNSDYQMFGQPYSSKSGQNTQRNSTGKILTNFNNIGKKSNGKKSRQSEEKTQSKQDQVRNLRNNYLEECELPKGIADG